MKTGLLLKISLAVVALVICLYIAVVGYSKYTQSSRLKQVSIATQQFQAKENLYGKLLGDWREMFPAKCGTPSSTPGTVAFESIGREQDGSASLTTNDSKYSAVSIDEIAKRLNTQPETVRSALDTLKLLGSPEIAQSGPAVKVISSDSDTQGFLHIDESCSDAATYASWSKQPGNFTADHPGRYIGLRSLGGGWYYYLEQR